MKNSSPFSLARKELRLRPGDDLVEAMVAIIARVAGGVSLYTRNFSKNCD